MLTDDRKNIVSLFDESGNALRPWANAGFRCFAFDLENDGRVEAVGNRGGTITFVNADLMPDDWREAGSLNDTLRAVVALRPFFVMGFPPCTDLATSGAKHFETKWQADPDFQLRAVALARVVETVGNRPHCPRFFENPRSVISTFWRKPDYKFHPCQYGGYLPEDDVHPRWSQYIAPRDAYEKETWLWSGNGFKMPPRRDVMPVIIEYENGVKGSKQFAKLGGKSKKTKQIRSETPRGFAIAVYCANFLWSPWN